ncbi:OmpA family protein [Sphingobacterium chuzhouense]|uniref:OmpA family protein n=1 Tax=Sphingobacterium chuzhouense TaxID=1742264 RepID=A0ABR7XSB0_9SPHI|nr:OmpA family protein [Sphingobacterium chuzhouense]MBD1422046.1 OmpA family protein [Sphingobacterium chuzhouense]
MAHLEVQPKSGTPWWVWLLLAIIALAIIIFAVNQCNPDSTETGVTDTTANSTIDRSEVLAATEPDWNSVDFNTPQSTNPDITDTDIMTRENADYTIYTIGENILFATDQKEIQGSSETKLKQIADALNERFKGAYIGVYGSADSTGTASHNKELGAERANAVKDWLINSGGIERSKVSTHSLGEEEPVTSNATKDGRQQNRNVQIVAFRHKQ